MFDLIAAIYNGMFMVFYSICSLLIFIHILKTIFNLILDGEQNRRGSYALITGCDSGFGYATAYELNKRGIYVFAACLTKDGVQRFEEDANFKGKSFIMNVTKMEDINNAKQMIENIVKDNGLWCLLNNAGVLDPGPIEWVSDEDMKKSINVNLWGAVNVAKAMIPLVKKSKGRIITTTSVMGRTSFPNYSAYSMAKYGLEAFCDSLRYEMKPWGISVHIIEPGSHSTDLFDHLKKRWKELSDMQPKEILERYGEDYHEKMFNATKNALSKTSRNSQHVVNAYLHAALSSRPKLRYLVGPDAKFLALIAMLPTAVGDFLKIASVKS